jgi:hypothetical protein
MNWRQLTIQYVKDLLRARSPMEMVEKELTEAQLAKLQAETSVEYSQAIVDYNKQRIMRLSKRIQELGGNNVRIIESKTTN